MSAHVHVARAPLEAPSSRYATTPPTVTQLHYTYSYRIRLQLYILSLPYRHRISRFQHSAYSYRMRLYPCTGSSVQDLRLLLLVSVRHLRKPVLISASVVQSSKYVSVLRRRPHGRHAEFIRCRATALARLRTRVTSASNI